MNGQGLQRPLLILGFLLCMACTARASEYGSPLGDLRLSFAPDEDVLTLDVEPFAEFSWYVIAAINFGDPTANSRDGVIAWEARVETSPEIAILGREPAGNPLTCEGGSCGDEWHVFLSTCFFAEDGPFQLVRYRAQLLSEAKDLEIRLLPPTVSDFDGLAPGWVECSFVGHPVEAKHPFATGWEETLVVNSSVAASTSSWSALKARY